MREASAEYKTKSKFRMCRERLTHNDANLCVQGKAFGIYVVKAEDSDAKADSRYVMIRIFCFGWHGVIIRVVFKQISVRMIWHDYKRISNRFLGS